MYTREQTLTYTDIAFNMEHISLDINGPKFKTIAKKRKPKKIEKWDKIK